MDTQDFDELAGRIDGIAQALLRVVSALEMGEAVDGPRMAAEWRHARTGPLAQDSQEQASRRTLHTLADLLEAARQARAAGLCVAGFMPTPPQVRASVPAK